MGKTFDQLKEQWRQVRGDAKWDFIRHIPGVWSYVAGGGALLMTIIAATHSYIESLSGPPLFQFIFSIFALFIVVLAFSLMIVNQVHQWWTFRRWERGELSLPISPVIPDESLPVNDAWLTEIAERDLDDDIGVIIIRQRADLHTPTISAPYIEFFWTVFNGLVWEVEIEARPTGHIFLYEGPLGWQPNYKRNMLLLKPQYETLSFPYSGGKRTIPHGDGLDMQLLYWLSPADVTLFKERISSKKGLDIAFNDFYIYAVKGPEGNKRRFRINLLMEPLNISELMEEEEDKV